MRHLVNIQILEEDGYELVEKAFIKYLEQTGKFNVTQFDRMEIISSREIKKGKESPK